MKTKILKCPKCGGTFEVKNVNDEKVLLITCPNPQCKAKIRLLFETDETILAQPESGECFGYIYYAGQYSPLKEGKQILGRSHSNADVHIPSGDKSMSRMHLEVDVVRLKTDRVKVLVRDIRDKAKIEKMPTKLSGSLLEAEDVLVLKHGDVLTLGNTQIKYVTDKI